MSRGAGGAALLVSAAALGGCLTDSPRTTVGEPTVSERGAEGAVLAFPVTLVNRAGEPLPLQRVGYTVTLDGREVFSGLRSAQGTLRVNGEHRVVLPAAIVGALPMGAVTYSIRGWVTYTTTDKLAEIASDAGVVPWVDFAGSGTLTAGGVVAPGGVVGGGGSAGGQ